MDDLKARIEEFTKAKGSAINFTKKNFILASANSAVELLADCLKRIEELEADLMRLGGRCVEHDFQMPPTCPKCVTRVIEHAEERLKAQLEAAEKLLEFLWKFAPKPLTAIIAAYFAAKEKS